MKSSVESIREAEDERILEALEKAAEKVAEGKRKPVHHEVVVTESLELRDD